MKNQIIKGTLILSVAGILTRFIGFYYRIFLSNTIGANSIGLYQMIFPLYNLCLSVSVVGIETAIAKYVAEKHACHSPEHCLSILKTGLSLALYSSIILSFLLYILSEPLATYYLQDIRCKVLLQYAAYAIPFCSIHGCILGYFLGKSNAWIPALAQLTEQVSKVGILFLLSKFAFSKSFLSPSIAMLGLFIGEFSSFLFCLVALIWDIKKCGCKTHTFPKRKLFAMAYPISSGRVLTSVILSSEAVLILNGLRKFGLLHDQALQVYGILSGMAMPFIFFPSTITTSLASMILPTISEAQSTSDNRRISKTSALVIQYCFAVGIFFTGIFFLYGKQIGITIYNNTDAGTFISILSWLCPFMYLGATLSSILNGLGLTKTTFYINISTAFLRITGIYVLIPNFGITGYLWGLLFCQIFSSAILLIQVKRHTSFHYDPFTCIIMPITFTLISILPVLNIYTYLKTTFSVPILSLCIGIILSGLIYVGLLYHCNFFRTGNQ